MSVDPQCVMSSSNSSTMPRRSSTSGLMSAQDLLKLVKTNGKNAFIRVKSSSFPFNILKWKQRFVILANNDIYIYADEYAKKPLHCVSLLGYNCVKRIEEYAQYPWSFCLYGVLPSMHTRTFACITDQERRDWMRKIKEHMYRANNIPRGLTHELDKQVCGIEDEYKILEEPVFSMEDDTGIDTSIIASTNICTQESFDDDDDLEDDDDLDSAGGSSGSSSVFHKDLDHKSSSDDTPAHRRLPPLPPDSANNPPPSYNSLDTLTFNSNSSSFTGYQNIPVPSDQQDTKSQSKFDACYITDPEMQQDRDACRDLLLRKCVVGAHLLRKSRKDDSLVLVVLTDRTVVKEYRLEEKNGLYRIFQKTGYADFLSMEEFINRYSRKNHLPGISHFLTFGVHECPDERTYHEVF